MHPTCRAVVATGDPPEQIKEVLTASRATGQPLRIAIVRDPWNRAARSFNAMWLPRAFALDEQGRIAYVQPDTVLDIGAVFDIEELWDSRGRSSQRLLGLLSAGPGQER